MAWAKQAGESVVLATDSSSCAWVALGAAEGREGFVQFRFAFPSLSSECQNLQIFLKFNSCLWRFPRQRLSEISGAPRRRKSGIREFRAELQS